jgi:hypothetical protein
MASVMQVRLRWCRAHVACMLSAGALCALAGCERPRGTSDYLVLNGVVETVGAETSELSVRVDDAWAERSKSTVPALLTQDTEIYINDRFSGFDAIAPGDNLEIIGYRESSPRGERFVVSLAYITRPQPPPPEPVLLTPARPATSQPEEK